MDFSNKTRLALFLFISSLSVALSWSPVQLKNVLLYENRADWYQACKTNRSSGVVNCRGVGLQSVSILPEWCRYVDLSHNGIKTMPVVSSPARLKQLDLSNNQISYLSPSSLAFLMHTKVLLSNNPFHCTCQLAWLHQWIQRRPLIDKEQVRCSSPLNMRGKKIIDWNTAACLTIRTPKTANRKPKETTHKPTTTTPATSKANTTPSMTTPDSNMTAPDSNMTTLNLNMTTPDSSMTTPNSNMTAPDSIMITTDLNMTTPDSNMTTTPDSNMTTPDSNMTTPDSNMTTPDSDTSTVTPNHHSTTAPPDVHHSFPWWGTLLIVIGILFLTTAIYLLIRRTCRPESEDSSPLLRGHD